jgi:hypothetical protein
MRTPSIAAKPLPADMPPQPVEIAISLTLDDRIAAAAFAYRDLMAKARRRVLIVLAVLCFLTLLGALSSAWGEGGKRDSALLLRLFLQSLAGPTGIGIAIFTVTLLSYYLLYPFHARRSLRRWFIDEGQDAPMPVNHRFDATGLASSAPHHRSHLACHRAGSLTDGPEHLFLSPVGVEDVVALPKRDIPAEQQSRLHDWIAHCGTAEGRDAAGNGTIEASPAPTALSIRFSQNLEDRTAGLNRQLDRPGMRRRRRRSFAIAMLCAVLAVPALMLFLWSIDSNRVPWQFALPLFGEMILTQLWKPALGLCALVLAIGAAHPWFRRQHARALGKMLQERQTTYETEVRFSESGVETRQDGLVNRWDWAAFSGAETKGEHIFLHLKRQEPMLLPRRALDSEQMAVFDRLIRGHIRPGPEARA